MGFAWIQFNTLEKERCRLYAESYKKFLGFYRTEREITAYALMKAREKGFKRVEIGGCDEQNNQNGKYIYINRNKAAALVICGKKKISEVGCGIIAAHIDSPRLDLKVNFIAEDKGAGVALLKTHYYGGIKKYQWVSIPLALTGIIVKRDGKTVRVNIGGSEYDPVFTIPDLLIHLSSSQLNRKPRELIKGEELNAIAWSTPTVKTGRNDKTNDGKNKEESSGEYKNSNEMKVSAGGEDNDTDKKISFIESFMEMLKIRYGVERKDLYTADLSLVPAIKPSYIGFDLMMIGAPGQDDRACAFAALQAILSVKEKPERTVVVFLMDREEIGSNGVTGAQSLWITHVIADIIARENGTPPDIITLYKSFGMCEILSADVSAVINPNFKNVHDKDNAAVAGKGVVIEKYSGARGKVGSSEATAEFMAKIVGLLERENIPYQFGMLGKVDEGGGSTVAKYFAQSFNADVIDIGPGLMGMHGPFEVAHIADLYSAYKAYSVFLKSGKL